MNLYRNHFGTIISPVVAICTSLIMATSIIFVDELTFTLPLLIKNWDTAFLVISSTGMAPPLTDWSLALCREMGFRSEILPHVPVEDFVVALFFNTTATIVFTAVNVFHNSEIEVAVAAGSLPNTLTAFMRGVSHDWSIMFIISYVLTLLVTKAAIRIAKQAVSEPKSPYSPQNQF